MTTALLILPNFMLILVGLALARRFDFGRDFWDGMEKLVYYVLFPALLFRSLALARIDLAATGQLLLAGLGITFAAFLLSLAPGVIFKLDRKLLATGSQAGYRFNTYVGLAIAGSLFGTPGVALAALLLGVMIPLANFLAVAMLASHGQRGFAGELARNPLLVSTLAGFAWNALGLPLPGFADQTLGPSRADVASGGAAFRGRGDALRARSGSHGRPRVVARDEARSRAGDRLGVASPGFTGSRRGPAPVRGAAHRHQRLHPRRAHDGRRPARRHQVTVGTVLSMVTHSALDGAPCRTPRMQLGAPAGLLGGQ
jgi:hypothetical protein